MPEFYVIIAQKYFSRILGGGGACAPRAPRLLRLWRVYSIDVINMIKHEYNNI